MAQLNISYGVRFPGARSAYNMMRMWQGAFGLAEREGLVSPAYVVLTSRPEIDPLYASHLFKTPRLMYLFWAYSYGLTDDRLRLYFPDFTKIPIRVPNLSKQTSIASALSTWDSAIRTKNRQLDICRKERIVLLKQFVRSTTSGNIPTKKKALGELAKFISGSTPRKEDSESWNGDVPWITAKDMKQIHLYDSELKITSRAAGKIRGVHPGTVLMLTRGMTLLRSVPVCLAKIDLTFNQDVKALVPSREISGEFLCYLLRANEGRLLKMVNTAGHGTGRLDTEFLKQTIFHVPPLEYQSLLIKCLSTIEQQIDAHQRQREYLVAEKRALVQKLLSFPSDARAGL